MWQQGIFSRERTAWIVLGLYTLFLYSTLSLAFDLYVSIYQKLGRATVSTWMNLAFLVAGMAIVVWVRVAYRPSKFGYAVLLATAVVVAVCLLKLTVPAKRFHFFEYAPLALLAFEALRFHLTSRPLFVSTIALVGLIGLGDEMIQASLPDRHFGLLDLGVNLTAGMLAILFVACVVGREHYPWGRLRRPPRSAPGGLRPRD